LNNGKDNLGKFDSKADEDILSLHGHAHRAYNRRIMVLEESMHIAFNETNQKMQESPKTGTNDEVPTAQQTDTRPEKKIAEACKLPKIQSIEQEIQPIESEAGTDTINSEPLREWRLPEISHWTM